MGYSKYRFWISSSFVFSLSLSLSLSFLPLCLCACMCLYHLVVDQFALVHEHDIVRFHSTILYHYSTQTFWVFAICDQLNGNAENKEVLLEYCTEIIDIKWECNKNARTTTCVCTLICWVHVVVETVLTIQFFRLGSLFLSFLHFIGAFALLCIRFISFPFIRSKLLLAISMACVFVFCCHDMHKRRIWLKCLTSSSECSVLLYFCLLSLPLERILVLIRESDYSG